VGRTGLGREVFSSGALERETGFEPVFQLISILFYSALALLTLTGRVWKELGSRRSFSSSQHRPEPRGILFCVSPRHVGHGMSQKLLDPVHAHSIYCLRGRGVPRSSAERNSQPHFLTNPVPQLPGVRFVIGLPPLFGKTKGELMWRGKFSRAFLTSLSKGKILMRLPCSCSIPESCRYLWITKS
jgi:hypothetical protein